MLLIRLICYGEREDNLQSYKCLQMPLPLEVMLLFAVCAHSEQPSRGRHSWAASQEQMHQRLATQCVKKSPPPSQICTSSTGADPMFLATPKHCMEHQRAESFFNSRLAFLGQNPQGYSTNQHIDSGCGEKCVSGVPNKHPKNKAGGYTSRRKSLMKTS